MNIIEHIFYLSLAQFQFEFGNININISNLEFTISIRIHFYHVHVDVYLIFIKSLILFGVILIIKFEYISQDYELTARLTYADDSRISLMIETPNTEPPCASTDM